MKNASVNPMSRANAAPRCSARPKRTGSLAKPLPFGDGMSVGSTAHAVALLRPRAWPLRSRPVFLPGGTAAPGTSVADTDGEVVGHRNIARRAPSRTTGSCQTPNNLAGVKAPFYRDHWIDAVSGVSAAASSAAAASSISRISSCRRSRRAEDTPRPGYDVGVDGLVGHLVECFFERPRQGKCFLCVGRIYIQSCRRGVP
jgi:hypothetical protein